MNAPAYPRTPIELMEDALTRLRIIARSLGLDASTARVGLTLEGSHFSADDNAIRLGLVDIAQAISLEKSPRLVFNHECYHFMAYLLQGKTTPQVEAIQRSLASLGRGKPPPYAYFFGMLHNLIVGVIDQGNVEDHRKSLNQPSVMIRRAEDDEMELMTHLAVRMEKHDHPRVVGETIEIISLIRSFINDTADGELKRYRSFYRKLMAFHDGCPVPSAQAALDLTLLFFLNRYQGNYEIRRLYIDLYRKIKAGHIFESFHAGLRKKRIELVHRPKNGNFNTYWNRYSIVPLRWVDASDDLPSFRKESSSGILPQREYAWQGHFTRTSFFRFKLCRLPLLQRDIASPAAVETPPAAEPAVDRDVIIVINPGNEMTDERDAENLFADMASAAVQVAEELREKSMAARQSGTVEIFLVVLGVVNDVSPGTLEDGLVAMDINRILGWNDYPHFAGFLFGHPAGFKRYLRDGMIEQFRNYHPDLDRRILVMSRVFTDVSMFDDKVGRIILLTHDEYTPGDNPYPYGDLLFTDESIAAKIEYRHTKEGIL